jgi:hypothetical protein
MLGRKIFEDEKELRFSLSAHVPELLWEGKRGS